VQTADGDDGGAFAFVTENALVLSAGFAVAALVLLGVSLYLVLRAHGGFEQPLRRKTHEESLSAGN